MTLIKNPLTSLLINIMIAFLISKFFDLDLFKTVIIVIVIDIYLNIKTDSMERKNDQWNLFKKQMQN